MMNYLIYILAVIGFILITNKSKLLKSFRESVTRSSKKNLFLYWLDSIMNCEMCMSPYAAIGIWFLPIEIKSILSVVSCVVLYFSLWELIKRK